MVEMLSSCFVYLRLFLTCCRLNQRPFRVVCVDWLFDRITEEEKKLRIKGMNFDVKDGNKMEYLAELEHILKITGTSDGTKQKTR